MRDIGTMVNLLEWEITKNYRNLRPSEQKVADYLLRCPEDPESLTLTEVSAGAGVSQPTVLRFAKAMGYDGFKELKAAVMEDRIRRKMETEDFSPLYGFPIGKDDLITEVPAKVIGTTIHVMQEILKSISMKEFIHAVDLIVGADSIAIYGVENSLCTVQDLRTKLLYLGLKCQSSADAYLQQIGAANLTDKDVLIGISYSGSSRSTVEVMHIGKKAGAKTIAITNFEDAPISKYADVVICTSTEQFLYGDAIYSRSSQLAVVDMLYMGVILSDYEKYTKVLDKNSKMINNQIFEIR